MSRLSTSLAASARNGPVSPQGNALSVVLPSRALRHLASSLKKQWRRYRKALRCCQEEFSPAAVHASRVDTRRLLSIVGLLSPFLTKGRAAKMQALLKRHLDSFDDLRDTQVQLAAIGQLKRTFTAAGRFCEYLLKRERQFSRETRRQIKGIKTQRLSKWIAGCRQDLRTWEQHDFPYAANALLLRMVHAAFARTQRLYDVIDCNDTKTIHRARIAFKKFRYMVEILAKDLPNVDRRLLRAMHDYQTLMGDIQDAQVLLTTYEEFLRKKKNQTQSARTFRKHLQERRKQMIQAYISAADRFLDFSPTSATSSRQATRMTSPSARRQYRQRPERSEGRRTEVPSPKSK